MFKVVEGGGRTVWCSTNGTGTYYIGQLVAIQQASKANVVGGTCVPLAVPAGDADTTNFQVIFGIVSGTNNRTPISNSTGEYITGVSTQALQLARENAFQEGMYGKGDPQALIQVTEITPCTVIEGPIFDTTYKAVTPVSTVSVSTDTDGMVSANVTINAATFTPVANRATLYCRSGANAGLYRVTASTSTTAPQVTVAFPYDIVVGDTFCYVPYKQGLSRAYIDGPGLFLDSNNGGATNNFLIFVYKLDLSTPGKESAQFRFAATHFDPMRA